MMKKNVSWFPSEREYQILSALWILGPSTVSQVQLFCAVRTPMGYTTVLKFLQIMHDKKMVSRRRTGRKDSYVAVPNKSQIDKGKVQRLLLSSFDGSAPKLVEALSAWKLLKTPRGSSLKLKKAARKKKK